MSAKKDNTGRLAVDYLRTEYENGRKFADSWSKRDAVMNRLGLKPEKCTVAKVMDWDRQARYEMHDNEKSVTSPIRRYGYETDPNAPAKKRMASRIPLDRTIQTMIANRLRISKSDARQFDTTRAEIETETIYALVFDMVSKVPHA